MDYDEAVDLQYACSKWCRDQTPEQAIDNHVRTNRERSAISQQTLRHESHVYVEHAAASGETKYTFFPSVAESSNLLVYIHGGFWQQMDVASSTWLASVVVPRFCNFAAIGYDLCPQVTLATIVRQVRKALKSLMERYPSLDEVYLCGHSAGAHLALMALIFDGFEDQLALSSTEAGKIKGLILISGMYDVRPVCQTGNNLVLNLSVEEAWRLSPIRCIANLGRFSSTVKILILVAQFDSPSFQEQSSQLNMLSRDMVEVEHVLVEGKDHFSVFDDIGQEQYPITERVLAFLGLSDFN